MGTRLAERSPDGLGVVHPFGPQDGECRFGVGVKSNMKRTDHHPSVLQIMLRPRGEPSGRSNSLGLA